MAGAQSFIPLAAIVELTPISADDWTDVDVSAHIPAGATGVILHVTCDTVGNNQSFGVRKNGSTDDRTDFVSDNSHQSVIVGVDDSRIFEVKGSALSTTPPYIQVFLIGYTSTGVHFLLNATAISFDTSWDARGTWQEAQFSQFTGARAIIIEVICAYGVQNYQYGARKKGSTDTICEDEGADYFTGGIYYHRWLVIGCDENQKVELYGDVYGSEPTAPAVRVYFYAVGYVTSGLTMLTNAHDKTVTADGSFHDVDCAVEAPNAGILIYEVASPHADYGYYIKEKGSSEEDDVDQWEGDSAAYHCWAISKCDASQLVEAAIQTTNPEIFLLGYSPAGGPTVQTDAATEIAVASAQLNGTLTDDGGEDCECYFEYGLTDALGTETSPHTTGLKTNDTFNINITNLLPATKYYFRAVAENTRYTVYGATLNFTTLGKIYPTEAITRVTNMIHRWSPGNYTLEMALGEVTSDFGLPIFQSAPIRPLPDEIPTCGPGYMLAWSVAAGWHCIPVSDIPPGPL